MFQRANITIVKLPNLRKIVGPSTEIFDFTTVGALVVSAAHHSKEGQPLDGGVNPLKLGSLSAGGPIPGEYSVGVRIAAGGREHMLRHQLAQPMINLARLPV
jgi:hypothetical protein